MVFWTRPPDEEERRQLAERAGAEARRLFEFDARERIWCDDLSVGAQAVLVEVTHALVTTGEDQLGRLLDECDPDPLLLNFAQGVVDAVPVHGSALFEGWQERLGDYPEQLQAAVIRRHAQIDHFWRWRMFADRDNPMLWASASGEIASRLHVTLLALNKRYGPGLKSPDALLQRFEIAPTEFAARLRDSFAAPATEQASILTQLINETYNLVESHAPAVDIARLREVFNYERLAAGPSD